MNDEVEIIEAITIPTKIKYKDIIWVPESKKEDAKVDNINNVNKVNNVNEIDKVDKNFTTPTEKPVKPGNLKKPYIVKWIEKKPVGAVFTLNQFYRLYPKLKKNIVSRKRVDKIINNMIIDNVIEQWRKDGKFKDGSFRVLK